MGYMSHRFKTAKIVCYVMLGDTTFFDFCCFSFVI